MATVRQKKLAKKISENVGAPIGKLMTEVGYSQEYAKTPSRLTKTTGWKEIVDEFFPDDFVAQKHLELLSSHILMMKNVFNKLTDDQIFKIFNKRGFQVVEINRFMNQCAVTYFAPDNQTRRGTLDLINKIKGTYAPEKHAHVVTGLENLSDEDIDRLLGETQPILDRFKKYGRGKLQQTEKKPNTRKPRKKSS